MLLSSHNLPRRSTRVAQNKSEAMGGTRVFEWWEKYRLLQEHMMRRQEEPKDKAPGQEGVLAKWLSNQRYGFKRRLVKDKLTETDWERANHLIAIDVAIWLPKPPRNGRKSPTSDCHHWERHLKRIERVEDHSEDVATVKKYLEYFKNTKYMEQMKNGTMLNSMARYMFNLLKVADIPEREGRPKCLVAQKTGWCKSSRHLNPRIQIRIKGIYF